jgi:histone RNA hairpin-binding protein
MQKMKQISYGKNTLGYDEYTKKVPKSRRSNDRILHPQTPDPYEKIPKRQWDGKLKAWRRVLCFLILPFVICYHSDVLLF